MASERAGGGSQSVCFLRVAWRRQTMLSAFRGPIYFRSVSAHAPRAAGGSACGMFIACVVSPSRWRCGGTACKNDEIVPWPPAADACLSHTLRDSPRGEMRADAVHVKKWGKEGSPGRGEAWRAQEGRASEGR